MNTQGTTPRARRTTIVNGTPFKDARTTMRQWLSLDDFHRKVTATGNTTLAIITLHGVLSTKDLYVNLSKLFDQLNAVYGADRRAFVHIERFTCEHNVPARRFQLSLPPCRSRFLLTDTRFDHLHDNCQSLRLTAVGSDHFKQGSHRHSCSCLCGSTLRRLARMTKKLMSHTSIYVCE
jgi:hypothetical protein